MIPLNEESASWVLKYHCSGLLVTLAAMVGLAIWLVTLIRGAPVAWIFWVSVSAWTTASIFVNCAYILRGD